MFTGTIRQLKKTCSGGGGYLCFALGPSVAGKDEGDPESNGEPGSPMWPAKQWALWFQ